MGTNINTRLTELPVPLTMNSQPLDLVSTYKYLGLTLNSQLTFREHTTQIINFASQRINSLLFFKKYVTHNTLLQIYKTTILPIFEYANMIHPLIPKQLNYKKQRLQNRALRIIYAHEPYLTREELHSISHLSSLEQRVDIQILCNMYKKSLDPEAYPQLDNTGMTRANNKIRFQLLKPTVERFKYFPHYNGAKLWDQLNKTVKKSVTYLSFKNLESQTLIHIPFSTMMLVTQPL